MDNKRSDFGIYLCYCVDISPVMELYRIYDDNHPQDHAYTRTLAIITAALYASDQIIALHALECFQMIDINTIPNELLNLFLEILCDACPSFICYFTTDEGLTLLVKLLCDLITCHLSLLSLKIVLKIFHVFFLFRHEAKQTGAIIEVVNFILCSVRNCCICSCQPKQKLLANPIKKIYVYHVKILMYL